MSCHDRTRPRPRGAAPQQGGDGGRDRASSHGDSRRGIGTEEPGGEPSRRAAPPEAPTGVGLPDVSSRCRVACRETRALSSPQRPGHLPREPGLSGCSGGCPGRPRGVRSPDPNSRSKTRALDRAARAVSQARPQGVGACQPPPAGPRPPATEVTRAGAGGNSVGFSKSPGVGYFTRRTDWTTIGSFGVLGKPSRSSVATWAIFFTTSMPETTLPKTQ